MNSVCRTVYYHLRNIGIIRQYLSHDAAKTFVHAFVPLRIDYFTFLPHGLKLSPDLRKCARIITRTSRRAHITPVLKELHCRPVHCRIQYKILSHAFCAIHHNALEYLSGLLSVYRPTRSQRLKSTFSSNC